MTRCLRMAAPLLLLAACGGTGDAPEPPSGNGIDALPFLVQEGTRLPYTRYTGDPAHIGEGQVFFLHPIFERREQLLALEFSPLSNAPLGNLFAEDMLGASGAVVVEEGVVRTDFLPIAVPIGVAAGDQWRLPYARREFACGSRVAGGRLVITCVAEPHRLGFLFDRDRGVLQFQDFCGSEVCTYRLIDGEGLLSDDVLRHMGLPQIARR